MLSNEQRRQIAYSLLDGNLGKESRNHVLHWASTGVISHSYLCFFHEGDEKGMIEVLFDTGRYKPGIGFFWRSETKQQHLESLRRLQLPDGFALDDRLVTPGNIGEVPFFRHDCASPEMMYKQIVNPGTLREQWLKLFETMKDWCQNELKCAMNFYEEERGYPLSCLPHEAFLKLHG